MPKGKTGVEKKLGEEWRKMYGIPEPEGEAGKYGWGKAPSGESLPPVSSGDYEAGWQRAQDKLGEILNRQQAPPAPSPEQQNAVRRQVLEKMAAPSPEPVEPTPVAPEEAAYNDLRKRMHPGYELTPEDEDIMRKYNLMGD